MKKTYIAPYIDNVEMPEHFMVTEGSKNDVVISTGDDDEGEDEDPNGARMGLWEIPESEDNVGVFF